MIQHSYWIWKDFTQLTLTIGFQVKGVAEKLKSNMEQGIEEDEKEVIERKNAFGSNTYPKKKGKSFYVSICCGFFKFPFITSSVAFSQFVDKLIRFCNSL